MAWQELAAKKRTELYDSIPLEWRIPPNLMPPESQADVTTWPETSGWFTPEELAITALTAIELLPKLASGQLKSLEVTKAFCKRAAAAHQLTNCLSETCFDRALSMASALDAFLAKEGRTKGPLHGLPISIKDNINLAGLDATVGFASHINDPAPHDAPVAALLAEAGAVFYVKTNVPTAMMMAETVNNVFGRTTNPRNRALTSGGSSGGESALLVLGGSPLGVGTDIGGSLRIPAACTGIFTLRPSLGRFPTLRCRSGLSGQEAVQTVNGPMALTLPNLEVYCRAIVEREPWKVDPRCVPIPWRQVQLPHRLRIGVLWHDGMVLPTPPVSRAMRVVVDKLRAAGHELVDWDPVDQKQGLTLVGRMFLADGGRSIRHELEKTGEPFREEMAVYKTARELSAYEMWQLHLERTEYQKRYMDRWNDAGLDGLLSPTTPYSGVPHGKFRHIGYTCAYNVLDYSCTSFPTGLKVDKELDAPLGEDYQPLSENCALVQKEYSPSDVEGMPISLQLIGRRLEEEKVLAMTQKIVDLL